MRRARLPWRVFPDVWLTDLFGHGRDRGTKAGITLGNGTKTPLEDLGRLELADWQATHQENPPSVPPIDLLQSTLSPADGGICYSTRVSLFTGEGGQVYSEFVARSTAASRR